MLRVKLLGDCSITWKDQPVGGISTDRQQALLSYLVLHHHAPQLRQRVASLLWPNSTDTQARANLRKELSYLRKALPERDVVLWVDAKTLHWQLSDRCWVDVVAFESVLKTVEHTSDPAQARSLLEQACELYHGNLLPDCDDEWIVPERERLQQRYGRSLELLIDYLERGQDYRRAIDYGQQLLRVDALNEAAYCALMRLYGLSGDRANGLQLYHRCMTVLREELGIDPSPATRSLYEQLLQGDALQPTTIVDGSVPGMVRDRPDKGFSLQTAPIIFREKKRTCLPLVGRDREWATVQQWMAADPEERELLLVVGEPGIGKTRLLQQVQETLESDRTHVLWGRGFEAEIVRPYGVWIDALRSLAGSPSISTPPALNFLMSESGTSQNLPTDRSRLFDAVVHYLSQLCGDGYSVLVVLDDIQWIDEASSALLHYTHRLLSSLPIWFACTARFKELDENAAVLQVIQALRRERRLCTLELAPLDPVHTTELVELITPASAPDWPSTADRIFVESGGNPLFALELARALAYGEHAQAGTLDLLIRDRLQRLSESARELIPWAAALGHRFSPTLVAHVADYPFAKLLMAIEQLERESIIRASTTDRDEISYDFAHDIVRQVAYRQLSEPRRRLVHLQIARQLHPLVATQPDLIADVAHHAALGGDRTLAASASLTAAERSLKVFAYAEAAELAQRGIQHCQALDDRTRIRLHLSLLRVIVTSGVRASQVPHLEEDVQQLMTQARALSLVEEEAMGYEVLLILHFDNNDFAKLQERSQQAVEASRAATPATTARMLAYGGSCLAEIGREMVRAEALLLEARSLAARVGLELIDIPAGLGCVYRYNGNYEEARQLLQQSWHLAQATQDHWRECNALSYLVMTELEDEHPTEALSYCQLMGAVAAQMKGEGSEGAIAQALKALAQYQLDSSTAAVALDTAIAILTQIDTKRMLAYVLLGAAEVDLRNDRPAQAKERVMQALQAAQAVHQPSDVALAQALAIQSDWAMGLDRSETITLYVAALQQSDRHVLSWRSRRVVDHVLHCVQPSYMPRRF